MDIDIHLLLSRRLIDMQGSDFVALARFAGASSDGAHATMTPRQAIGISALADALSCSSSQVANMRRDGALDGAIISHVGRNIVFDVEKARAAANEWKKEKKPAEGQA